MFKNPLTNVSPEEAKKLLEEEINKLSADIIKAEEQKSQYADLTAQIESATKTLEEKTAQISETETALAGAKAELSKVSEEVVAIVSKHLDKEAIEKEIASLVEKKTELESAISLSEISLSEKTKELEKKVVELNLLNDQIFSIKDKPTELKSEIDSLRLEREEVIKTTTERVVEASAKLLEIESQIKDKSLGLSALEINSANTKAEADAYASLTRSEADKYKSEQVGFIESKLKEIESREGAISVAESSLEAKTANLRTIKSELEKIFGKAININL